MIRPFLFVHYLQFVSYGHRNIYKLIFIYFIL